MEAYHARKSVSAENGQMPRRSSMAVANAAALAAGAAGWAGAEGEEADGYEGTTRKPSSDKEEFFDVTIVRDMVGGTLGIAVDLWDGDDNAPHPGPRPRRPGRRRPGPRPSPRPPPRPQPQPQP